MSKPERYKHQGYYTEEPFVPCPQPGFEHRFICRGCLEEGHIQLPTDVAYDCKMVLIENKVTKGQCCCYSKEHGLREEQ